MIDTIPHKLLSNETPVETIKNDEVTVYIYRNIIIVEVEEGVNVSYEKFISISVRVKNHFGTKPWVYISNRINSYSINPNDFKYINSIPSIKAVAIVQTQNKVNTTEGLESLFCKKPYKVFDNINSAYEWGLKKIYN